MKMEYKIEDIIEGNVTGIQSYGVFISLDKNTQGLIHYPNAAWVCDQP
jgi:general stress protein 13